MKLPLFLLLVLVVSEASVKVHPSSVKLVGQRIVGGEEAGKHEFPSMLNKGSSKGPKCGATLIHPKWALTAAHCGSFEIVVGGDHLISTNEGTEVTRNVIRRVLPQDYEDRYFTNDIALLELETEFDITDKVQVAQIAPANFVPTGTATVVGWGKSENGVPSNELRKVRIPVVENGACNKIYQAQGLPVDQTMICAGASGQDSCDGDFGGPLFCESENGPVYCGIVSWGIGCGREGFPGVYTRTSSFRDFIETTINAQLP